MKKIALGLITALLLASCSYLESSGVKSPDSGVGHPDVTYPGPRTY